MVDLFLPFTSLKPLHVDDLKLCYQDAHLESHIFAVLFSVICNGKCRGHSAMPPFWLDSYIFKETLVHLNVDFPVLKFLEARLRTQFSWVILQIPINKRRATAPGGRKGVCRVA